MVETQEYCNVARFLPEMAGERPEQCAVKVPLAGGKDGERIRYAERSFAELNRESDAAVRLLQEKGIGRGTRVLLMVRPGLGLILLSFALFKLGAIPIIIDPGMGLKNFLACVRRSKPEALIGIPLAQVISRIFRAAFRSVRFRISVGTQKTFKRCLEPYFSNEDCGVVQTASTDSAAILFTSGSTGPPKGVCYEHGMFEAQVRLIRQAYTIEPGEIDLPMLPIFALFNPALRMTTVVPQMNPSRPAKVDPQKIVQAIHQNEVTTSFGSPVLWTKIGRYCEANGIILPSIRRLLIAGAPVPPSLFRQFEKIIPNGQIHTPYGATESLPVSSITGENVLQETWALTEQGKGTCVGKLLPEMQAKIIAIAEERIERIEDASEMFEMEVGEIIVNGPVVTKAYDQLLEETAKSKIQSKDGIWHRIGDLGYFDGEGRLWFCGRKAERVRTEAGDFYTDCCEAIFNKHPDVFRSALVGLGTPGKQRRAIVVEPEGGCFPKKKKERERFIAALQLEAQKFAHTKGIEDFLFYPGKFPVDVRHNAKINRIALAKWAERQ